MGKQNTARQNLHYAVSGHGPGHDGPMHKWPAKLWPSTLTSAVMNGTPGWMVDPLSCTIPRPSI